MLYSSQHDQIEWLYVLTTPTEFTYEGSIAAYGDKLSCCQMYSYTFPDAYSINL